MAKTKQIKPSQSDDKIYAFLCYLITIIGVIIVLATKKERSDFSIYHAKQGLVLFIAWIILWVILIPIQLIPILGAVIYWIIWVLLLVLWILGMINALNNKKKPLPVIGGLASVFKF